MNSPQKEPRDSPSRRVRLWRHSYVCLAGLPRGAPFGRFCLRICLKTIPVAGGFAGSSLRKNIHRGGYFILLRRMGLRGFDSFGYLCYLF
jgi:hypothetical protein